MEEFTKNTVLKMVSNNYVLLTLFCKQTIVSVCRQQKKRVRYVYNINRNFLLRLLNILPQRLQNKIIYKVIK